VVKIINLTTKGNEVEHKVTQRKNRFFTGS
jgi:hypothetical protein